MMTLLEQQRERAERLLNGVRAIVLLLLGVAALAYAPTLAAHPGLNRVNLRVLIPMMCWTAAQYLVFYRRGRLPEWLMVTNPIADISAVTAILLGYGLAGSASLALKSPLILAYFVVLGARPIATSTRRAAYVATLVVLQYSALLFFFIVTDRIEWMNPVDASSAAGLSILDEAAKLLLLAVAGAVATYATAWHERMATGYYEQAREREILKARLGEAQMESLKLQLQPHFLFNTLNAITALISTAPRAAEIMINRLSELLRVTLRNTQSQEVPLYYEIETLQHYIDIQRARFQDRLTVVIDISPDVHNALVPNLILQPLVENAIKHGIAPRSAPGVINVRAFRDNGSLMLVVQDNGIGSGVPVRDGLGIGNARARLEYLYGEAQEMSAESQLGAGFSLFIKIPFHLAEVAA